MENNWIEHGARALDLDEKPYGLMKLSHEEMANWHEVALCKIKAVMSDKLLDYTKANPYISIGALFSKRYGITQKDFDQFVNEVVALFEGSIPICCSLDYCKSIKRNMITVNFSKMKLIDCFKSNDELRKLSYATKFGK